MTAQEQPPKEALLTARIERVVYGGSGLTRIQREGEHTGAAVRFVPFTLSGELVEAVAPDGQDELQLLRVLEVSPQRVEPGCPHFGVCGGCHLQMASYAEQLRIKRDVLEESLQRAGVRELPEIATHTAEPWGYRNRIRLHLLKQDDALRLGYREREEKRIFAADVCPIAAPLLWSAAEAIVSLVQTDADVKRWLNAAAEVELFCDGELSKLQMTLLVKTAHTAAPRGSFERAMESLRAVLPQLAGAGAVRVHPRTGEFQEELGGWGAAGLAYEVRGERHWVPRGGFFQVNRFLLPTMVNLVCEGRSGTLAWDLFAGVGLFARVLARSFERVTAVEANPAGASQLASALRQIGAQHRAERATTLDFLRRAVIDRDRPELIVLDPPRAGAGEEASQLLARIAPAEIVYVSCDPVTLGRDLGVLQEAYKIAALHLLDLFPQTYHQEAVVLLQRRP